jgi:hypothetical protein
MRNCASVEIIERAEALLAELKAIAVWDRAYWECRRHELGEAIALVSRFGRRIEILSELIAIVAAMCRLKRRTRGESVPKKTRETEFFEAIPQAKGEIIIFIGRNADLPHT